eukprot:TRINITY_DN45792_c0_g1_i1.p1 TRINITY_DN45792_c0_g1~~TRINITY_DN45792_c0_g1_i1.p1  ORF type:complete len:207 (-),score=34.49 TRINITY_DN45792_c0_g1_i1:170-790(-)
MIRRPPRSTLSSSSAASDVYKRQPLQLPLRTLSCLNTPSGQFVSSECFNYVDIIQPITDDSSGGVGVYGLGLSAGFSSLVYPKPAPLPPYTFLDQTSRVNSMCLLYTSDVQNGFVSLFNLGVVPTGSYVNLLAPVNVVPSEQCAASLTSGLADFVYAVNATTPTSTLNDDGTNNIVSTNIITSAITLFAVTCNSCLLYTSPSPRDS